MGAVGAPALVVVSRSRIVVPGRSSHLRGEVYASRSANVRGDRHPRPGPRRLCVGERPRNRHCAVVRVRSRLGQKQLSGVADRAVSGRRELAQAAARHPALARRVDLGIVRQRLRRDARPHLGRDARRAAAAGGRGAVDALRGAQPVARQRPAEHRRPDRHVRSRPRSAAGNGASSTCSSSSTATATWSTSGRSTITSSASSRADAGRTRSR